MKLVKPEKLSIRHCEDGQDCGCEHMEAAVACEVREESYNQAIDLCEAYHNQEMEEKDTLAMAECCRLHLEIDRLKQQIEKREKELPTVTDLQQYIWDYLKGTELKNLLNGKVDCVEFAQALHRRIKGGKDE